MIEELYIDGKQVDIPSTGLGISLNLRSNLFSDIDKIVGNYTNTIHLPKTDNNMAVFDMPVISSNSTFPYQYHEARYLRDGIEIISSGKAVLLSVSDTFEISIIWGVLESFINLKGYKLTELTNSERATLSATPTPSLSMASGDVIWAAYESGYKNTAKPNVPVELPFLPSVPVSSIISQIQTQFGLSLVYPQSVNLNELLVPIVSRRGDYSTYGGNIAVLLDAWFTNDTIAQMALDGSSSNILTVGNSTGYMVNHLIKSAVDKASVSITGGYITQYIMGDPSVVNVSILQQRLANSRLSAFTEDDENLGYITEDAPTVAANGTNEGYACFSVTYAFKGTINVPTGGFKIYINVPQLLNGNPQVYFDTTRRLTGRIIAHADIPTDTAFGYSIPVFANLPEVDIIEFLKSINALYCLYPIVVGNSITFQPINKLSSTTAVDWTSVVEIDEELSYRVENFAQNNFLKWMEDDSVKGNYDGNLTVEDENLERERTMFTMPFAAADGYAIPSWTRVTSEDYEFKAPKPKLMRRVNDETYVFACFSGFNFEDIISEHYAMLQTILNTAKIVKVKARLTDIQVKNFDPSIPVYISQYGAYFAVMDIKSQNGGGYEITIVKI